MSTDYQPLMDFKSLNSVICRGINRATREYMGISQGDPPSFTIFEPVCSFFVARELCNFALKYEIGPRAVLEQRISHLRYDQNLSEFGRQRIDVCIYNSIDKPIGLIELKSKLNFNYIKKDAERLIYLLNNKNLKSLQWACIAIPHTSFVNAKDEYNELKSKAIEISEKLKENYPNFFLAHHAIRIKSDMDEAGNGKDMFHKFFHSFSFFFRKQ